MNYKLGIDIGSTTVKLVVLNEFNEIEYDNYVRHFSNIKETLIAQLKIVQETYKDKTFGIAITGSGGMSLAKDIQVSHVQEVIAVTKAIKKRFAEADVVIEIGGEDAKIIYLKDGLDQRMNGICAGGTGSFIDQMATLLKTDANGINNLATNHKIIYPIAARCGVFAKADIQPLINEGVRREDIAASIFQAVVNQTISGLACGKPIKGNVCFLGGPLHFMPELKKRFVETLKLQDEEILSPENSHLFAALGSALSANHELKNIANVLEKLNETVKVTHELPRLSPLFTSKKEYNEFQKRHALNTIKEVKLKNCVGDVYLGIDAGSTTAKLTLISSNKELLWSHYEVNHGNPLQTIQNAILKLYDLLPETATIKNACVTGYGEHLIKEALKVDVGEIETVAHFKGANHFYPGVDFILDIGGQDMKCLQIKDGIINSIMLNEACSSGCGSFIETFAKTLNCTVEEFANLALHANHPIDLGSRCTVFMNSRVKQAQKEGATVADISAGLSYSVIKNTLQKVIKIPDPKDIGEKIVVQGGTFYNESVLRAFELLTGREIVRPSISGLMGAFGAALIAFERQELTKTSALLSKEGILNLKIATSHARCRLCSNECQLTINKFSGTGSGKFVSGNRCERGAGKVNKNNLPNMYQYKEERTFAYTSLTKEKATRGTIGIPRVLNMYENYPMWHTFLTNLGFEVVLSKKTTRETYELGMESIPSESECYPAKLVHGHIQQLINDGIKTIFYPSVVHEVKENKAAKDCYNCPIVISYPENIKNNLEDIKTKKIKFVNPFFSFANQDKFQKRLVVEMQNYFDIPKNEVINAFNAAIKEVEKFKQDIKNKGKETLEYLKNNQQNGVVLAGRPYHVDSEINHGIADLITGLGLAVLTEDSIAHLGNVPRPLEVVDQWTYHSRLYEAADFVSQNDHLEFVQLNSFGCGIDAVTTEEISRLLEAKNKLYTCLKIDEVNNLGTARIRIRSLIATINEREASSKQVTKQLQPQKNIEFTKQMRETHTILCPQMSPIHFDLLEPAFQSEGYNLVVLDNLEKSSIDTALKYVHNDACYPSFVVIGQILDALNSGKYDLNNVSIVITQTGGGCRSSNYINFLRKALKRANFEHVPVVSLSANGMEKHSGVNFTLGFLQKGTQALVYGDLFMRVTHRMRPYELTPGSTNALYNKWRLIVHDALSRGKYSEFKDNVNSIVREFDNIKIDEELNKPRIGIVGEILVKYHPVANNNIVEQLEQLGAEVVALELVDFFLYGLQNATAKYQQLHGSLIKKLGSDVGLKVVELYRKPVIKALKESKHFDFPKPIQNVAKQVEKIVSLCNQTGEGWFLTGEMLELIESGVPNIVCVQPFACLPNHITGKGVIKEIKKQNPTANIVAIDYDAGASEVNQLNRIMLMLTRAKEEL